MDNKQFNIFVVSLFLFSLVALSIVTFKVLDKDRNSLIPNSVYNQAKEKFGEDRGFLICNIKENKCLEFINIEKYIEDIN